MIEFIRKATLLKILLIISVTTLWVIPIIYAMRDTDDTDEPVEVVQPVTVYDVDNSPSDYESDIELYTAKTDDTEPLSTVIGGESSYWYFTYNYTNEKGKKVHGSAIKKIDVPYYDDFKLCKLTFDKADGDKNAVILSNILQVTENSYKAYKDAY